MVYWNMKVFFHAAYICPDYLCMNSISLSTQNETLSQVNFNCMLEGQKMVQEGIWSIIRRS